MTKVLIKDKVKGSIKSITDKSLLSKVFHIVFNSNVIDKTGNVKNIKQSGYPVVDIKNVTIGVKPKEVLPFRVKFTTIGIQQNYGPGNPAPIGIAVIGLNNYIL